MGKYRENTSDTGYLQRKYRTSETEEQPGPALHNAGEIQGKYIRSRGPTEEIHKKYRGHTEEIHKKYMLPTEEIQDL